MLKTRTVLFGVALVLVTGALAGAQESALAAHLRDHPGLLDDGSMGPLEARVLDALTPEQAEAWAAGEDPSGILLESGESLAEFISALLAGGQGLVYVSLDRCLVLRTVDTIPGAIGAGTTRSFLVRGETTDLSAQGGSATGCLVPADAVAVALHLRLRPQTPNLLTNLFAGRTGGPGMTNPVVEFLRQAQTGGSVGMSIVGLCEGACAAGDFDLKVTGSPAHVRGDVIGYFRFIESADLPSGFSVDDADTLDGLDSTDFALASHTHDGGDITSGTVGEPFIDSLIARDAEVLPLVLDNDGSGSGLDADLLDGRDSTDFMLGAENCLTVSPSCPAAAAEALATRCWQTISAALAEIGAGLPPASAGNRYLIKVGPGVYADQVNMVSYVDIEGAGEKVTTITDDGSVSPGTVRGADNVELRHLTVESTGPAAGTSIAFHTLGNSPMLRHVTLLSKGGANNLALVNAPGSVLSLVHVTATAAAETAFDTALENQTATVVVRDSVLQGDDGALVNNTNATANVVSTQLIGPVSETGGGNLFACLGAYDAAFSELGTDCQP